MKLSRILLAAGVFGQLFLYLTIVHSDVICLKNGVRLYGRIIEQQTDCVKIAVTSGTITVNMTDVVSVEDNEHDFDNALKEYQTRAGQIEANSAAGHFELAVFCFNEEIYKYARGEFEEACRLDQGYKAKAQPYLEKIECLEAFEQFFCYYEQGQYADARGCLERIIKISPETEPGLNARLLLAKLADKEVVDVLEPSPAEPVFNEKASVSNDNKGYKVHTSFGPEQADKFLYSLVGLLEKARSSVDMAFGQLDVSRVIEALIQAKARGVKVRVLVTQPELSAQLLQLKRSSIDVRAQDNKGRADNYFCIVDNRYVWLGMTKGIETDLCLDISAALEVRSEQLADNFNTIFERIWLGQNNKVDIKDHGFLSATLEDVSIETYFASGDNIPVKIRETISRAREGIDFCAFEFDDTKTAKALVERYCQGVPVKGILEHDRKNSLKPYQLMAKKGLAVKWDGFPRQMRLNMIIIDQKTVIISSSGFNSRSSGKGVLMVIKSQGDDSSEGLPRVFMDLFEKVYYGQK